MIWKQRRSGFRLRIPLELYRRHRKFLVAGWIILGIFVALLSIADHRGWLGGPINDWNRYHGQSFRVARVIDGDTLEIEVSNTKREYVRLWGIDTPELARPDRDRKEQPYAAEATSFTKQLCDQRNIRLMLQRHQIRDRYERVLAYVILEDKSVLNERLVAAGLAKYDDRFSHDHIARYRSLQQEAKSSRVGIWSQK